MYIFLYTNPEKNTRGTVLCGVCLELFELVELNRINVAVPLRLTPFRDCRICDLYVQNCYRKEAVKQQRVYGSFGFPSLCDFDSSHICLMRNCPYVHCEVVGGEVQL